MIDALLDGSGNAGAAVAFFYEMGELQFVHFTPVRAETAFQVEAIAMELALRE
jgi:threonine synthase